MASRAYVRKIVFAGIVGALYAALTIGMFFISFGPLQFRIAEALTVLPFFFPFSVWGLFVGCIVANLFSPYGWIDVVGGSLASLIAGLCTMRIGMTMRRESLAVKAFGCAPPVVFNAVVIGAIIGWAQTGGGSAFLPAFIVSGLQVGLGQLVVLYVLGLPLMHMLPKMPFFDSLSGV